MTTIEAALTVLTRHGYSNALELSNEIDLETMQPEPLNKQQKQNILFEILCKTVPVYEGTFYNRGEKTTTKEAIQGGSRIRELVELRHIGIAITHKYINHNYGLRDTASYYGHKDHSTIIFAIKNVERLCFSDVDFKRKYNQILTRFLEATK